MPTSLFGTVDVMVTQYLYGLATHATWTEYIAIFFSDGILIMSLVLYIVMVLPLRKNGTYTRTFFHDAGPALLVGIAAYLWKYIFPLARPYVVLHLTPLVPGSDPMSSFPSFHVAVFAAFACTILFHYRKLGAILITLLPLVMIGRVAIGVHWASDVVAGAFFGIMGALRLYIRKYKGVLAGKIVDKLEPLRRRHKKSHDAS